MNKDKYMSTFIVSMIDYVVQALVINFSPLLFVTFQEYYQITLSDLTFLVTFTFIVQFTFDVASAGIIKKLGTRKTVILANDFAAFGLLFMPDLVRNFGFAGLLISTFFSSLGASIIEVLVTPIVEVLPAKRKAARITLLHSFYSWGSVITVLLSTVFFAVFGVLKWTMLCRLWALVPLIVGFAYLFVPIIEIDNNQESGTLAQYFSLLKNKKMRKLLVLMMCGGAAEIAVSQWVSNFAEKGLGIDKVTGDLFGPMGFALAMGMGRLIYPLFGKKIKMKKLMSVSSAACVFAYLLIVIAPLPWLSLVGCVLCGFSVAILWPGTISMAAGTIENGGAAMFALIASAGDFGCMIGPALVGFVSGLFGGSLRIGLSCGMLFPLIAFVMIRILSGKGFSLHLKR